MVFLMLALIDDKSLGDSGGAEGDGGMSIKLLGLGGG